MKFLFSALLLLIFFGSFEMYLSDPASFPSPLPSPHSETTTTTNNGARAGVQPPKRVIQKSAVAIAAPPEPSVPTQSPPTPPPASFAMTTEAAVVVYTNNERTTRGLLPLAYDPELSALARAHSADMIAQKYFDHNDPEGCGSSCRANAAGYEWSMIGENIYMSSGYEVSADEEADMTVDGWMNSPGHRANILKDAYTHTGVGVVVQGESVYVTAMYAKPR